MSDSLALCTSITKCLFDFQALISGVLAIIAAVATAIVIWKSAQLPIKEQSARNKEVEARRRQFISLVLCRDLRLLATRAQMAEGTITVTIAAKANVTDDTRKKTTLEINPIIGNWEFMSLLPKNVFDDIMTLHRKVEDHNFDMYRAGGSFGADNFRESIYSRVKAIQSLASRLSNEVLNVNADAV